MVESKTAVAISYSRMICGARLPIPLQDRDSDWLPEAVIGLEH